QETEQRENIIKYMGEVIEKSGAKKLDELLSNIFASLGDKEQEIDSDSVNILTMHKAKGLTADAVFIVAAEDEYIPGERVGQEVDDERRLLYVSLTRARHSLFLTYCRMRKGRQRFSGRSSGNPRRHLTEFLTDSPISPESGTAYIRTLHEQ
ncbi:MAG: ATP-binding domain-containing protein, partial [Dehalococcoidia bacterium]|nr:ATP-binding domain-containing protein [Dehalococcoidia bacterium]